MWLAGVGTSRDYLITVQLGAALYGTDSLIVTQSDDGGITYPNGALISQALLAGTPETGFHSNIVAFPGNLGGATPNSAVYTTFTSADGVDLYVASCAAPCNLPILPPSGPPSKLSFTSTLAFTAPPGAALGNVFTPIAVDNMAISMSHSAPSSLIPTAIKPARMCMSSGQQWRPRPGRRRCR